MEDHFSTPFTVDRVICLQLAIDFTFLYTALIARCRDCHFVSNKTPDDEMKYAVYAAIYDPYGQFSTICLNLFMSILSDEGMMS